MFYIADKFTEVIEELEENRKTLQKQLEEAQLALDKNTQDIKLAKERKTEAKKIDGAVEKALKKLYWDVRSLDIIVEGTKEAVHNSPAYLDDANNSDEYNPLKEEKVEDLGFIETLEDIKPRSLEERALDPNDDYIPFGTSEDSEGSEIELDEEDLKSLGAIEIPPPPVPEYINKSSISKNPLGNDFDVFDSEPLLEGEYRVGEVPPKERVIRSYLNYEPYFVTGTYEKEPVAIGPFPYHFKAEDFAKDKLQSYLFSKLRLTPKSKVTTAITSPDSVKEEWCK